MCGVQALLAIFDETDSNEGGLAGSEGVIGRRRVVREDDEVVKYGYPEVQETVSNSETARLQDVAAGERAND